MGLKIRITRVRGEATAPRELTLRTGTATIGRSRDSDVCLDDPERVISSRHALIEVHGNEVWITDISRNGTYMNQSIEPLPPHQPVALGVGDRVIIGPFELGVSLDEGLAATPVAVGQAAPREDIGEGLPGLFATGQPADILDLLGGGGELRESGLTGTSPRLSDDPFADAAALDSKLAGAAQGAEPQAAQPPTPVEHVYFRPPAPQAIPDDYDIFSDAWTAPSERPRAGTATPSPNGPGPVEMLIPVPAYGSPASPAEPFEPEPLSIPVPPAPAQPSPGGRKETPARCDPPSALKPAPRYDGGTESAVMAAFLEGLGVADGDAMEHPEELMHDAGALMRELVAGLIRTLMGRAQFKSELRLGVTTIRPVENNPFKFAVDPGDVLDRLLFRPNPGFLPPVAAAREAFNDIRAHEMAMTAGLQAALRALLARFEPAELERHLSGRSTLDQLLPMARKSRYWDLFTDAYQEVAADAAEDFMRLFGDAFAAAYREQIKRLAEARGPVSAGGRASK
jgi:type VI secretion system FHA domain protein